MTDKEFKRLSRSQLIDIIYQLQLKQKELEDENKKLKSELADKRIRIHQAGNIAEASLAVHKVMEAAQAAADQYLEEIRLMKIEAEKACRIVVEKAQRATADMAKYAGDDAAVEAILKEYKRQ